MGSSQREKGARGEREACKVAEARTGIPWRRTGSAQRRQGSGLPDIVPEEPPAGWGPEFDTYCGLLRLHIEVKYSENTTVWAALKQVAEDVGDSGRIPVVLFKRNRKGWTWHVPDEHLSRFVAVMQGGGE